jgi:catalase
MAIGSIRQMLEAGGASMKVIAPRLGDITGLGGRPVKVDHSLPTVSSVAFDAVFIPGGKQSVDALCADANAVLFVKEAYKHGKAVAASDEGAALVSAAARSGGAQDAKFRGPGVAVAGKKLTDRFVHEFFDAIARHRFPERPDIEAIIA